MVSEYFVKRLKWGGVSNIFGFSKFFEDGEQHSATRGNPEDVGPTSAIKQYRNARCCYR